MALATVPFAVLCAWRAKPKQPTAVVRLLTMWGAGYALGIMLASVQLLPFLEYSNGSMAATRRIERQSIGYWLPMQHAWTFVNPDLYGVPEEHAWWGRDIDNAYCGILPLLLAPVALFSRVGKRRAVVFCLVTLLTISLGVIYRAPIIYDAIRLLPGMKLVGGTRLLLVAQFALALLGGLGLQTIMDNLARSHTIRPYVFAVSGAGLVLLAGGVAIPWSLGPGFFGVPISTPRAEQIWSEGVISAAGVVALVTISLLITLFLVRYAINRQGSRATLILAFVPVTLLLADLLHAYMDFLPTVRREDYFPQTEVTTFLSGEVAEHKEPFRVASDPGVLMPNTNLEYGFADLRGYDAVDPRLYYEMVFAPGLKPGSEQGIIQPSAILNLTNTRYVVTANDHDPNYLVDAYQASTTGTNVGEIWDENQPGQTFTAHVDTLSAIQVLGATFGGLARGTLVFHLKSSPHSVEDIITKSVDAATLTNNRYWMFSFPSVSQAKGRTFYFYFEAPDGKPGNAATLWYNNQDSYADGSRYQNGEPTTGDLAFRALESASDEGAWFSQVLDGGEGVSVYENNSALPRAWLVHDVEVIPDADRRVQRLIDPGFDPRRSAVLNSPLPGGIRLSRASGQESSDTVTITKYAAEHVDIEVKTAVGGLLVLGDLAFPGWHVYVDDDPSEIIVANHALRGVTIPPGSHTVRFEYAPATFTLGAVLSLMAAAGLLLLAKWRGLRSTNP
jgi:hypothetical protein